MKRWMTKVQIERAIELRELGHGYDYIGKELGFSGAAIRWQCMKHGAEPKKNAWKAWAPGEIKGPSVLKRLHPETGTYHVVRRFTPEEDAELLRMVQAGVYEAEIARRLKRRTNSIRGRLMTLARRQASSEAA